MHEKLQFYLLDIGDCALVQHVKSQYIALKANNELKV